MYSSTLFHLKCFLCCHKSIHYFPPNATLCSKCAHWSVSLHFACYEMVNPSMLLRENIFSSLGSYYIQSIRLLGRILSSILPEKVRAFKTSTSNLISNYARVRPKMRSDKRHCSLQASSKQHSNMLLLRALLVSTNRIQLVKIWLKCHHDHCDCNNDDHWDYHPGSG